MKSHPILNVLHTTGTAGTILVSMASNGLAYRIIYIEQFDFLFLIFWSLCVIISLCLLQTCDRTRSYTGLIVAVFFGLLYFATPVFVV